MSRERVLVSLCAPPRCHCPSMVIDFEKCEVEIKDDYEGTVRMSLTDMTVLARRFLEEV